ncbi:hypothetical protein DPEC_G00124040 [Dallia pectoralis]|uniref:Uncharacterized protein n=1 Tax=Dallia pectoralis TaxID=75939 RepID=A0ACC2GQU8_DALPE|nr:hypothetical protein DPEC_G00124040 [Dallia pectoralis]
MVSEDSSYNLKDVQRISKSCTKDQINSETSIIHLSSPVVERQEKLDGSSLTVYGNRQEVKVVYEVSSGDVCTMENSANTQRRDSKGKVHSSSHVFTNGRGSVDRRDHNSLTDGHFLFLRESSSSPLCSGPEDNWTDAHETLTETSTMTFADEQTIDESGETHSLLGVIEVPVKEFVLIDDDDDGDMSLREKTVTDLSVMDGNAADLVCGRLLSVTTDMSSECKEECRSPEPLTPAPTESQTKKQRCCFCSIL